jgi:hypothetical protein
MLFLTTKTVGENPTVVANFINFKKEGEYTYRV